MSGSEDLQFLFLLLDDVFELVILPMEPLALSVDLLELFEEVLLAQIRTQCIVSSTQLLTLHEIITTYFRSLRIVCSKRLISWSPLIPGVCC